MLTESFCLTNLSTRSSNFVDNISEHNILIVVFHANLLPLNILPQANVISDKRMWHATDKMNMITVRIGWCLWGKKRQNHLLTYEAFRSLNSMLAVTFSLMRFLAVWSNIFRYLWHCKGGGWIMWHLTQAVYGQHSPSNDGKYSWEAVTFPKEISAPRANLYTSDSCCSPVA